MNNYEQTIDALNDLVFINNDRIRGYEKAIGLLEDHERDLATTFRNMVHGSEANKQELASTIRQLGGTVKTDSTTQSGKLYRLWMDIRGALSSKEANRENALELCEFGEDAAQKAYQKALESEDTQGIDVRQLILRQKDQLLEAHNTIRNLRDSARAAKSSL